MVEKWRMLWSTHKSPKGSTKCKKVHLLTSNADESNVNKMFACGSACLKSPCGPVAQWPIHPCGLGAKCTANKHWRKQESQADAHACGNKSNLTCFRPWSNSCCFLLASCGRNWMRRKEFPSLCSLGWFICSAKCAGKWWLWIFWFKIHDANKSQRTHTSTAITQLALSKDMSVGQAFRCASLSRLERHMCHTQKACVCVAWWVILARFPSNNTTMPTRLTNFAFMMISRTSK